MKRVYIYRLSDAKRYKMLAGPACYSESSLTLPSEQNRLDVRETVELPQNREKPAGQRLRAFLVSALSGSILAVTRNLGIVRQVQEHANRG